MVPVLIERTVSQRIQTGKQTVVKEGGKCHTIVKEGGKAYNFCRSSEVEHLTQILEVK